MRIASKELKHRAAGIVQRAVEAGSLKRPSVCSNCGNGHNNPIEAHHHDYSKPLDVVWLCRGCHRRLHAVLDAADPKPKNEEDLYPSEKDLEIHRWVRANPGVTKRIAALCNVSRPMVSRVLHGHCNSYEGNVERELERLQAPGWITKKGPKKA